MKLTVCKEINSMILNDKTISSLQPNVSPGRYNLKLQAGKINFKNSSARTIFQKPISQSVSFFNTFGHPYLLLHLVCYLNIPSLF